MGQEWGAESSLQLIVTLGRSVLEIPGPALLSCASSIYRPVFFHLGSQKLLWVLSVMALAGVCTTCMSEFLIGVNRVSYLTESSPLSAYIKCKAYRFHMSFLNRFLLMLNTSVCYSWMTFHLSFHSEQQCIQGSDLLLSFFELVQQSVKSTAERWSELVFV